MPRPSRSSSRPAPAQTLLRPFVAAIALAAATDGQPRSSWVQLFKTGKFWDDRYGNFSITTQDLSQIVANFGTPTIAPVDYNHGTSRPVSPEAGKAAGRIVEVEIRANGDQLWGRVEWTEEAARRIEAGEYMAMSPTFAYDYKHSDGRKLGTTLLAAALCNRPVLDGMAPVEIAAGLWLEQASALRLADADEAVETAFTFDEIRRRIQAALSEYFGLGTAEMYGPCCGCYLLDLYDGRAIFRLWRESADGPACEIQYTLGADGVVTFTSDPIEVVATWTPLASPQESTMSKPVVIKDTTGKEITLSAEQIAAIVSAHAPAPTVDLAKFTELQATVTAQGTTITDLSNKNAELALAAKTRDAAEKVEKLIHAGKATPVEREDLTELALSNGALFDKLAAKRPVIVRLNQEIGSAGDAPGTGSGEIDMAVQAERTANPKLTAEQAYAAALEKNPGLYELAQRQ